MLGAMYCGTDTPAWERRAVGWYRKSAFLGDPLSLIRLGMCRIKGFDTTEDEKESSRYFSEALPGLRYADADGDVLAQGQYSYGYGNGYGASKDEKDAVNRYATVAEQGYAVAQGFLGFCYDHGHRVSRIREQPVDRNFNAA